MAQQEIQKILQKKKRFVSTDELETMLKDKCGRGSIIKSLKAMLKYKEVERRDAPKGFHIVHVWRIKKWE